MAFIPEDAFLESLVERLRNAGGIDCADLRIGDKLDIVVADGQKIHIEIVDPAKGLIGITSCGPWVIRLHLTDDWGMALTETGGSCKPLRLCAEFRLYVGAWETPAVTQIKLNGFDLTAPSAQQKN